MSKENATLRPVDAPLYGYWQALYLSFYSRRLYVDVAKRWKGYGVIYIFLVIAIVMIPIAARIIYNFNQFFDQQMLEPLKKLPALYVQNGKVEFDKSMPYVIKNSEGEIVAMIDTTGAVSKISNLYPHLTILITKDTLYFRPPTFQLFFNTSSQLMGDSVYAQKLSNKMNEVFVGREWIKSSGVLKLKWMAEAIVYPLMTGFAFGIYSVLMLFYAFFGQIFSIIIFKFRLSFKEACRIFLVASTPQVTLFFVLFATQVSLPGGGFIHIALLSVYFSYAILAVKRESKKMVLA